MDTLKCDTQCEFEKRRLPIKFEINRIERTGHSIFYSIIYIWGEVAWSRLQTRASFRVVTFESTQPTTLETASSRDSRWIQSWYKRYRLKTGRLVSRQCILFGVIVNSLQPPSPRPSIADRAFLKIIISPPCPPYHINRLIDELLTPRFNFIFGDSQPVMTFNFLLSILPSDENYIYLTRLIDYPVIKLSINYQ